MRLAVYVWLRCKVYFFFPFVTGIRGACKTGDGDRQARCSGYHCCVMFTQEIYRRGFISGFCCLLLSI